MELIIAKKNKESIKTAYNLAWPAVIESFFIAFAGIVDSLMVSSLGPYAVAAVGLTTQPRYVGLALFIAINIAVSAMVARRKGEENRKGANSTLLLAVLFTVTAGVLVSIACVVFAEPIMLLSGAEPDTFDSSVLFFKIIMGCMMFNIVSLVINSALRGCGNTRISMKTNLTGNLINIIGNYLLVQGKFGFPMLGVAGSAIATVIGTVVACIMSISSLFDKNSFISIPYMISEKIGLSFDAIKPMMKITLSTFSEQILLRIGFMSVAVMAAKQGTAAFAAHQVGMNIMGLSFSFGDGMQMAAVSLIGQSLGQEKPEMAKKYGSICQAMGVSIAIVLSILYLVFGRMIYEMFFAEVEIIDIGVTIMKLMVIIVLMQLPQVIFMGCLRGAGDVVFTTIASTISVTILRPLASFVFCYTLGFGIVGLWLGVVVDQFVRLALTTWRFSSGVWTKVKL